MSELHPCCVCGKQPTIEPYASDGGGRTSNYASVSCTCGFAVVKTTHGRTAGGQTGWDVAKNVWRDAMNDAQYDWQKINKPR